MEKAVGVFQHEKSEGLNEYLTALGVPLVAKWGYGLYVVHWFLQEDDHQHQPWGDNQPRQSAVDSQVQGVDQDQHCGVQTGRGIHRDKPSERHSSEGR